MEKVEKLLGILRLASYMKQIDAALDTALDSDNRALSIAARNMIQPGSKRLRCSLLLAVATINGKRVDRKMLQACATIELIHLGSLVHDDIIDDAQLRWGRPTLNASLGANQALVVGDFLLAKAEVAAAGINQSAAGMAAAAIAELCAGELREQSDRFNRRRTRQAYESAISQKTGALFAAACQLGGLCGQLPKPQVEALTDYGRHLGVSFQLIDDLMDIYSSESLLGKPVGTDYKNGVYTLPVILAAGDRRLSDAATGHPRNLAKVLLDSGATAKAITATQRHNRQAVSALDKLLPSYRTKGVKELPAAYLDYCLSDLVRVPFRQALLAAAAD